MNGVRILQILTKTLKKALQTRNIYHKKCKKEANFKKLQPTYQLEQFTQQLQNQNRSNQPREMRIDINKLNEILTSIGPKLSKQAPKLQHVLDIPCFERKCFYLIQVQMKLHDSSKKLTDKKVPGIIV